MPQRWWIHEACKRGAREYSGANFGERNICSGSAECFLPLTLLPCLHVMREEAYSPAIAAGGAYADWLWRAASKRGPTTADRCVLM